MKGSDIYELAKNLLLKVQSLSRTQAIAAAVAGTVAVGGVGTGGYIIYNHNHNQPTQEASAEIIETEELQDAEEAVFETEMVMAEVLEVTEVMEETEETETAEVENKVLSLVASSMEKDLKIKIVNQKSKAVSGELFEVSVKENKSGANATTYQDKDKDGIIYIDKLDGGNYVVDLMEIEGYEIKKGSITVAVKDQLEYKKVDVTGEVKTEKEVNTSVEDTAVNNVPVESTLTDTVPLLESTVSASTVEKSTVDQSNFTAASASSEKNAAALSKTITSSTESTEKPSTEKPAESEKPGTPGASELPNTPGASEAPSTPGASELPNTPGASETPSAPGASELPSTPGASELPGTPGASETPANPPAGSSAGAGEAVEPTEQQTASVERNSISRTATAAKAAATATVFLPKTVTLYNCDNPASTSYKLTLEIQGDASLIKSVSWATTNAEIAALSGASGNTVTVSKGSNSGTRSANVRATITYIADDKGNTKEVYVETTVKVVNMTDTTTVLKDKSGNELYKDSQAQTKAVLSDYHTSTKFYTAPKYTGWRTIDGKVYYFGADNKAVTGNQVIGGVTYTFAADGSLSQSSGTRGIDVSKWQGKIDWGAVAASGINFAIIRVGYRGASTGALVEDPYFKQNIAGATRAGIKVGVYFFTQAVSEAEAVEEASMAISLVSGYRLSFPIFIDTESASNGRANGLDVGTRTAVVNAFCKTVASAGYRPGIYASKSWYNNKLHTSSLNGYYIWVAQYNSSCTYSGKYNMWQYTSKGSVPGIKGNVDMNICY